MQSSDEAFSKFISEEDLEVAAEPKPKRPPSATQNRPWAAVVLASGQETLHERNGKSLNLSHLRN